MAPFALLPFLKVVESLKLDPLPPSVSAGQILTLNWARELGDGDPPLVQWDLQFFQREPDDDQSQVEPLGDLVHVDHSERLSGTVTVTIPSEAPGKGQFFSAILQVTTNPPSSDIPPGIVVSVGRASSIRATNTSQPAPSIPCATTSASSAHHTDIGQAKSSSHSLRSGTPLSAKMTSGSSFPISTTGSAFSQISPSSPSTVSTALATAVTPSTNDGFGYPTSSGPGPSNQDQSHNSTSRTGIIAGAVTGSLALVLLLAVICCLRRGQRRRRQSQLTFNTGTSTPEAYHWWDMAHLSSASPRRRSDILPVSLPTVIRNHNSIANRHDSQSDSGTLFGFTGLLKDTQDRAEGSGLSGSGSRPRHSDRVRDNYLWERMMRMLM
ncbi:hypothetical protein D9758_014221 [Tetrapyrgos nigripes]|uniref:Uncharacterized protein n=1 Tax=Tetrapyrgos nigripes TaxID=182062 RepID=A0A8H5FTU3_9AGAR|nr:hypothetical protein D9758_014221 [Tetrapyrgos nigripes]